MTPSKAGPRPFVDFYSEHRISPVSQDLSDLKKHFERRESLYLQLGLPPFFIQGKSVIEFGPGGGHNALYTARLKPARYLLVEANPTGIARLKENLSLEPAAGIKTEITECMIEDFRAKERFDLVLCEGVIPGQIDPAGFTRHVASFAKPGGMVVVTCADGLSFFSETLRRIMARLAAPEDLSLDQRIEILTPVFAPHLASLPGASRPIRDWIADNLLQPIHGEYFSISQAIEALSPGLDPHGSSPSFFTDWRWYKDLHGPRKGRAAPFLDSFQAQAHNLLDRRFVHPPRTPRENLPLIQACEELFSAHLSLQSEPAEKLPTLAPLIRETAGLARFFSPQTADSIDEFLRGMDHFQDAGIFPELPLFTPFFGRGQQYLSFVRRDG